MYLNSIVVGRLTYPMMTVMIGEFNLDGPTQRNAVQREDEIGCNLNTEAKLTISVWILVDS